MDTPKHDHFSDRFQFRWESNPFFVKLNTRLHETGLRIFTLIVLAHWAEHLAQAVEVYVLQWPLKESRGILGLPFPWLVTSEFMHYAYALIMLVGIWVFRRGFVGRSYTWWMIAMAIQFWHHIEHLLLQGQALIGRNLFGAPAPISVIQMIGFLNGSAESGFGGLLMAPTTQDVSFLMLFVRRIEVHMIYNTLVFVPMVIGMYFHLFPTKVERTKMQCSCAWDDGLPVASADHRLSA